MEVHHLLADRVHLWKIDKSIQQRLTFLTLGCDKFNIKFLKDNDSMDVLLVNDSSTQ